MPGQWMCHQIDTVHWFTGLRFPRSVVANGGIYHWQDGRKNWDTMTAVFDYGSLSNPANGFQVIFTSRMHNSEGGIQEKYYSNAGELDLIANTVSARGGLRKAEADAMAQEALIPEKSWRAARVRSTLASEDAIALADEVGVHPAIVAGRLRHEEKNFRLLSHLIGKTGQVSQMLEN